MTFSRYAVYFTCAPGPLAEFGAAWLGWDAARGTACAHPQMDGLPAPIDQITATPRKYGFHGTVKPPFRLAEGTTAEGLAQALAAFCATRPVVPLQAMAVTRLGRFLALTPQGDVSALSDLAGATVRELEPFRAPLTEADLERRRKSNLTPRQDELLQTWGYPYVMEEFRFHMTLSGRLDPDVGEALQPILQAELAPILPAPFPIDGLTLCGEDAEGRFHELHRYALSG